ncbi:MAG: hypothetical protein WKG01_19125 [Kofleriaceae bacterium]
MRNAVLTSSILGLAALTGCPDRTISEVNPSQGRVEYKDIPVNLNRNVDIMFVIDDSGSMKDKQDNLTANFPNFINVLNTIQGGLPDVHIGVVSSDMGTKTTTGGAASNASGCSVAGGKNGVLQLGMAGGMIIDGSNFISDIKLADNSRQTNYTGSLSTVFGSMAQLGIKGCGFEQHLHAMRRALENNPMNAGFIRPDAFLAVIFIADEDDCSIKAPALLENDGGPLGPLQSFRCTRYGVTCDVGGADPDAMNNLGLKDECHPNDGSEHLEKVQTFVDFLKAQKPDPNQIIVAGIIGTTAPFAVETRDNLRALAHSCTYTGGGTTQVADPPTRIQFFLDQFPNRSTSTSICQQDLSGGLQLIAQLLKTVIGDPCIEGNLADVDPDTDGDQFDCSASYVQNFGKPNQTEMVLPTCNDALSNKPCFHLIEDLTKCPLNSHLILKVEETAPAANGTHLIANCVTEAI